MTPISDRYDAVVIGAGPAGAVAARELALAGRSVLLVDKATFPRKKVCGCCLNGNALAALAAVGLHELPARLGAVPLNSLTLATEKRSATVPLAGLSLSREALDVALIREAVSCGVEFVSGCRATMGECKGNVRQVWVKDRIVSASVVMVADGLNGRTAANAEGFDVPARARSRIGAGVVLEHAQFPAEYHSGTIFMATGQGGYVGLVLLETGQLDIAAAFDSGFVKESCGLGNAATKVLAEAGFPPIPALFTAEWRGTPALTRTPERIGGERWLAIGDSAGYVEPFTGEGMAWAIGGAAAAARLAAPGWTPDLPAKWRTTHYRLIGRRKWFCQWIAPALRWRGIRRMMVHALRALPLLSRPFIRGLNRPPALSPESLR